MFNNGTGDYILHMECNNNKERREIENNKKKLYY